VEAVFLDLPLLAGQEIPHQPHLAVTATPWPGSVAVFSSHQDAGYQLNRLVGARSTIGETLSTLDRASHGLWDRGAALRVRMTGGSLSSASSAEVFNGANLMAIGDGTSDNWELLQFREATLVAPDTYDLAMRLRGQSGTDAVMPAFWPAGSTVVLLDGAPKQIALAPAERDLARHYRIGPARRAYDDPSYLHRIEAFRGNGLRPLSVSHLAARRTSSGDFSVQWVRRTRVDGDSWSSFDVPLGETRELYVVRVFVAAVLKREVTVSVPQWIYPLSLRTADGAAAQPFEIQVAQISDSFGPGPYQRKMFHD
jgi:hypothetical protein